MPKPKESLIFILSTVSFIVIFPLFSLYLQCLLFLQQFFACKERSIIYYFLDGMERKRIRLYEGAASTDEVVPIFCNALVL